MLPEIRILLENFALIFHKNFLLNAKRLTGWWASLFNDRFKRLDMAKSAVRDKVSNAMTNDELFGRTLTLKKERGVTVWKVVHKSIRCLL
jgi:hypothetical protein